MQLQDGAAGGGFATTGFAHEAEGLAALYLERDAVDGLDRADLSLKDDALRQREVHDEVANVQKRRTTVSRV
jgi:hypothetical protein